MNFGRMTSDEYSNCGTHRIDTLNFPYSMIVEVLGSPFFRDDPNFPDDNCKVDVCWGIKSAVIGDDSKICIWNYKNGPAYNNGEGSVEEISNFSVWHNSAAFYKTVYDALCVRQYANLDGNAEKTNYGKENGGYESAKEKSVSKFKVVYKLKAGAREKLLLIEAESRVEAFLTAYDHLTNDGVPVSSDVSRLKFSLDEMKALRAAGLVTSAGEAYISQIEEYKITPKGKVIG